MKEVASQDAITYLVIILIYIKIKYPIKYDMKTIVHFQSSPNPNQ